MTQYIVMNQKKGQTIVGKFFSVTNTGEASLYDEKTADLILNLMWLKGMKGFQKYEYLG